MSTNAHCFPRAEHYAQLLTLAPHAALREQRLSYYADFHWTERHLQCVWFDSRYRPDSFPIQNNEHITVLDPGEWNLEAGPDFLNATLLISPGERRLTGDIEIHVRPSDWDHHKHSKDPAYQNVIAHVTWAPTPIAQTLPAHIISLSFSEYVVRHRERSLDDIDLLAYPHAILPETPRPCAHILSTDPETVTAVLKAAAHYRLQKKYQRFLSFDVETAQQLFYEECMAALGYKQNANAFRILSRRVPASTLMGYSRDQALAHLLGAANLLPRPEDACDAESHGMARMLWDLWWHVPHEPVEPQIEWKLSGLRPQNHPVRRISAAAALFSGIDNFANDVRRLNKAMPCPRVFDELTARLQMRCTWPYWNEHLAFSSQPTPDHQTVLLGASRGASMITNVVIPFALAQGLIDLAPLDTLPPEDLSAPMRTAANLLLGRDHNPAFYATNGLLQQGLLQIYHDFCLNMRADCETCALLKALKNASLQSPETHQG